MSGGWIFSNTDKELNKTIISEISIQTNLAVTSVSETFALTGQVANKNLNVSESNMETKKVEILSTIENLSAIAEENAASTEEASAAVLQQSQSMAQIVDASSSLSKLAEELSTSVSKFKVKQ